MALVSSLIEQPVTRLLGDPKWATGTPDGPARRRLGPPAGGLSLAKLTGVSLSRTRPLHSTTVVPVSREPPGALAERGGSERWPDVAAARPGRVARLEAVQKVLTDSSQKATAGVRCRYPGTGSPLPSLMTQRFVRIGVIPESNRRARR
jgi:hypothetical protein